MSFAAPEMRWMKTNILINTNGGSCTCTFELLRWVQIPRQLLKFFPVPFQT